MLIRLAALAFLHLVSMTSLFAQLNESDTVKVQYRVAVTGNYQKGNVEVFAIKSRFDLVLKPLKNWVFKSQNSSLYQAFYSTKADNDIFSRNYIYYKPQHKIYPFAIGYVSGNYRRKIEHRYFIGAGITWQVLTHTNAVLKFSASTVYEETKFNGTNYNDVVYNGDDGINCWRGTVYLGGWAYLFQKHIRLYYDAFWQPAFNNKKNYRTQVDVGIDLPIWKQLSLNALFSYMHENIVVDVVRRDDTLLTFGFAYNLKIK